LRTGVRRSTAFVICGKLQNEIMENPKKKKKKRKNKKKKRTETNEGVTECDEN
jgi:hypothetical protein